MFARYLIERSPRNAEILINQPLSFKSRRGTLRIKPDLSLIVRKRAVAFMDVKMDLGFKRDEFAGLSRERDKLIRRFRGQTFITRHGVVKTEEPLALTVARNLKYHVVVVSGENIDGRRLRVIGEQFKKLRASALYILTEGVHPNNYLYPSVAETLRRITMRAADFKRLVAAVRMRRGV